MAKFCGKCGAELRDSATFCDSCGAKCAVINTPIPQATAPTVPISTATQVTPAVAKTSPTLTTQNKKSKKGLLIAIIAAVLVVAITLTTIFVILPMFKKTTNKEYVVAGKDELMVETSYGTFYQGLGLFDIDIKSDDLKPLGYYGQGNLHSIGGKCVTIDDIMYLVDSDNTNSINKVTFKQSSTSYSSAIPQTEEWLTQDDMYTTGYDNIGIITEISRDWQYDNDYIYFYIWPSKEYFDSQRDYAFLFGRIHTGNKAIEIYNPDIAVISYVVYDGWIYYSENGWDRNTSRNTYDYEKAGIYKMRTDGSEKIKLRELTCLDTSEYSATGETAYTNLSIYDGKLYFIDNSDPFNSLLYRMDLDGGNSQQVSTKGTYEYTFDTSSDTLYYVTGSLYRDNINEVKDIYSVSLDNFSETLFANYAMRMDRVKLTYHNGNLYFHSYDQQFGQSGYYHGTKEKPSLKGIYYDIDTSKPFAVYEYSISETEIIDYGFAQSEQIKIIDQIYYWDDYDTSSDLFTFYN